MDNVSNLPAENARGEGISLVVDRRGDGMRIDHFLVQVYPEYSRSQIAGAVKKGHICVDNRLVKAGTKVHFGEKIHGNIECDRPLNAVPQRIDFDILFEDSHILGLAKPPGVVVHPAAGNPDGTLVNGLLHYFEGDFSVGDPSRPGIVHRLDKDTSGVMVVAKTDEMERKLVDLFKSRQVTKKYLALIVGVPQIDEGRIVAPIGRHPVNRKKMAVNEINGKYAATRWHVIEFFGEDYCLVQVEIETGRTHQIRVHMASLGHPVAGDGVYGKASDLFPRQMLHASELRFVHPATGKKVKLTAPLPEDFQRALDFQNRMVGDL